MHTIVRAVGLLGLLALLLHNALPQPTHGKPSVRSVVGANQAVWLQRTPSISSSITMGGSGDDLTRAVAVGSDGSIYIVGTTTSSDLPTVQPAQSTFAGSNEASEEGPASDAFVAKLDPSGTQVVYATYLGGSRSDEGTGIAVDVHGNAYVTGGTRSPDFSTKNALQPALRGESDAFVAKLDGAGALVYATYLGGSGEDNLMSTRSAIAVDGAGAVYVTGRTQSADFPTKHAPQPVLADEPGGGGDAFVAKLNPVGSDLVYATYLGGSSPDNGVSIAVDTSGSAYVWGETGSPNFPTVAALQPTWRGFSDGFVAKLNPFGTGLDYATFLGGSGFDYASGGIAVDAAGNAYVSGETQSADFPLANAAQAIYGGGTVDIFVAKLDAGGSALVYATYVGREGYDTGSSIAVDAHGNAYVTGSTDSPSFPTLNAVQATFGGGSFMGVHGPYAPPDAFVLKLNAQGQALAASFLGGNGSDGGTGIVVDTAHNVYITGGTSSTNFPTPQPARAPVSDAAAFPLGGPPADAFVVKLVGLPDTTTLRLPPPEHTNNVESAQASDASGRTDHEEAPQSSTAPTRAPPGARDPVSTSERSSILWLLLGVLAAVLGGAWLMQRRT